MPEPQLHLDADASSKALHAALVAALVERGHDVTRTPTDWMPPSMWSTHLCVCLKSANGSDSSTYRQSALACASLLLPMGTLACSVERWARQVS